MGLDFASYQIFCGNDEPEQFHQQMIVNLPQLLLDLNYKASTATRKENRVIVVGPPGRWVGIFDSYAQGINPIDKDVGQFAQGLSKYGAVVNVSVYDSAILHLYLYRNGNKDDQYVNAASFHVDMLKKWEPDRAYKEEDFYGNPEKWKEFIIPYNDITALQTAWSEKSSCIEILKKTAELVGWDPHLCLMGYMVRDDGTYEIPYSEYFEGHNNLFTEFCY